MTYARTMMFKALKATWQDSMDATEAAVTDVINQVIERCAKEAEPTCKDEGCEDPAHEWCRDAVARIRALATSET